MASAIRGRVPPRVEENYRRRGDLNGPQGYEYRLSSRDRMRCDQQRRQEPCAEGGFADPCRTVLTHEVENLREVRRSRKRHTDERRNLGYRKHV